MLLLGFNSNDLCAPLYEAKGEPLTLLLFIYICTVIGFIDLLARLNIRTIWKWDILAKLSKGGSLANIVLDLFKRSAINLTLFLVDVVYLLWIVSEMTRNQILPCGKKE